MLLLLLRCSRTCTHLPLVPNNSASPSNGPTCIHRAFLWSNILASIISKVMASILIGQCEDVLSSNHQYWLIFCEVKGNFGKI
jgi:hypothetical protein